MKKDPERSGARTDGRGLLALEVTFVLVVVAGLALWSVPAALMLGGVLGVLACERTMARREQGAIAGPARGAQGEVKRGE
ncbi:hypothetical protein ACFW91_24935 [Streptomyces asoensis]|uniref:hypothetical protein n=1 Tax=Streptomyces asoensis TaxID=249586 RepID=UPI0036785CFC